jgi:outer membrane protein assembly factor BamA
VRTASVHATAVRVYLTLFRLPHFLMHNTVIILKKTRGFTPPPFFFAFAQIIVVDSLGGDLFWAAGASLITHIPRKPHWPVKAHAFLNAGQLEPLHRHEDGGVGSSLRSSVSAALSQPSISTGVGLIYHFDPVRVEVNFGVPLAARASDGTRKGVQVGIGLEFL